MNVASLELCRELYEVSDWCDTFLCHYLGSVRQWIPAYDHEDGAIPAYDLGYLMRKLPHKFNGGVLVVAACNSDEWCAQYFSWWHEDMKAKSDVLVAGTPEDAACKLAIMLFKRSI